MNERVKLFLERKQNEINARREIQKTKTLISLGLYVKKYSPDDTYSPEYCESELDSRTNTYRYYKKDPITVTDDEYEEILKYSNPTIAERVTTSNSVANALIVIACLVFIFGFFAGIVFGNVEVIKNGYHSYTTEEFSLAVAMTYWFAALVIGMMMLGFAEILKLLTEIKNK